MSLSRKSFLRLFVLSFFADNLLAQSNYKRQKLRLRTNAIVAPYLAAADFQGVIGIQKTMRSHSYYLMGLPASSSMCRIEGTTPL